MQIGPTTDKKKIRKAYAARSKEIHPEEKPEEFKLLYQAYKSALAYAGGGKGGNPPIPDGGQEGLRHKGDVPNGNTGKEWGVGGRAGQERQEKENQEKKGLQKENEDQGNSLGQQLSNHFSHELDRQKLLQLLIDNLRVQWGKAKSASPLDRSWQVYLSSEDFKRVQWSPQAIDFLGQETQQYKNTMYCVSEEAVLVALWKAYGFQVGQQPSKAGRLYANLYTVFLLWQDKQLRQQKEEKQKRRKKWIRLAFIAAACVVLPYKLYAGLTKDRRYVEAYMEAVYPGTVFTKPQKIGAADYFFYSESHPGITITAKVRGSGPHKEVIEDYGTKILEYYSGRYGAKLKWKFVEGSGAKQLKEYTAFSNTLLRWDFGEGSGKSLFADGEYVAYYPDIRDAETFSSAIVKMLQEQKELDFVDSFGICAEGARYPLSMLEGGELGFPRPQHYQVEGLADSGKLAEDVREGYIDYMFHYEPWNLAGEQKKAWAEEYKARGRKWEEEGGGYRKETMVQKTNSEKLPYSFAFGKTYFQGAPVPEIDKAETALDLYIPVYYSGDHYGEPMVYNAEPYISVGNAYQLLEGMGTDAKAEEDGSGFTVKDGQGQVRRFGDEAEVKLEAVLPLIHRRLAAPYP